MKQYIVELITSQWNDMFLVKAENKKDAIQKVWDENFADQSYSISKGYTPYYKKELKATDCDELYKENGDVVCIH